MKLPIYLDYAATTPVDYRVAKRMTEFLTADGAFGNPASSTHLYGWQAKEAVEQATQQVASLINAKAKEIIWTSGATESNNLAIKGAVRFLHDKGNHIITLATEHKAVLDTCRCLENQGFEITYLKPKSNGLVDLEDIKAAIRPQTLLISVMHVNNEIGVIQDIAAIGQLAKANDILFHVDAAQSMGKILVDVEAMHVDLMSLTAHKLYGPKGIGALYVRSKPAVRLLAQIHGGGHQFGMRSGTMPTHQIVGMGEACAIAMQEMATESVKLKALRDKLWQGIKHLDTIELNGDWDNRVTNNLNVTFKGVPGEPLMMALSDIAISSTSACSSGAVEPSHVLKALGKQVGSGDSVLRMSVGRYTTEVDIETAIALINEHVPKLATGPSFWQLS